MDTLATTATAARKRLEDLGWTECRDQFRPEARCFFKRHATPTRCALNDDKPGMQVCIAIHTHEQWWSFSIEVHGQLVDGTWIKLHQHGFPADLEAGLASISRLLSTWEHIATANP